MSWNPTRSISISPVVYSSSVKSEATLSNTTLPPIPDSPSIPDVSTVLTEPTFQSLGLGGWSPPGIVQNCLEYLHGCNLPWWECIVISTIVLRILVIPVVIIAQRNAATLNNVMPEMQKIQLKISEARAMGNAIEVSRHSQELVKFMSENKVNPIKSALVPLAQAPIFISVFMALRQMVNANVESLETGGVLWFENLTLADPYYALPIFTSLTLLATIELGVDTGRLNATNMHNLRYALRAFPLLAFVFTMNFPAAMLCYWSTSNVISLLQVRMNLELTFWILIWNEMNIILSRSAY